MSTRDAHGYLLSEADIESIFGEAPTVELEPGEILVEEDTLPSTLDRVDSGLVAVLRDGVTVAMLGAGGMVGEQFFLERRKASATVVAEQTTRVRRLEIDRLEAILATHPDLAARFYRAVATALSMKLRLAGRVMVRRRPVVGGLSTGQIPSSLRNSLRSLGHEFEALSQTSDAPASEHRVRGLCDAILSLMEEYVQPRETQEEGALDLMDFPQGDEIREATANHIARETFPWLMTSAFVSRGYARPRGIAEDYETVEMLHGNEPSGDGPVGAAIDRWALSRPWCRARRTGRADLLKRLLERADEGEGAIRLLSLGSGTFGATFEAMQLRQNRIRAVGIDLDPEAIRQASARARHRVGSELAIFVCRDVRDLVGAPTLPLELQDAILLEALPEHLDGGELSRTLEWSWMQLAPGGILYISTLAPCKADRLLLKHILQWDLIFYSAEDLAQHLGVFPEAEIRVEAQAEGHLIVGTARKP